LSDRVHFSGLNGIRAIAALAVVFSHTTQGLGQFGLDRFVLGRFANGNAKATLLADFGVSMFFALSGFLITYLLLEEKKKGEINIRNFYIRRILRIWPLYYLFFGLTLLTAFFFDFSYENASILFYMFLLANIPFIFGGQIPFLSHFWSLGVEEQFYSFWPWVVKKSKSILKITVIICLALIAFKTAVRLFDISSLAGKTSLLYDAIHTTRFQCMLIGAIGAILYHQKHALFLQVTDNKIAQLVSWIIILLVAINMFHVASFIDNEIIALVTIFLIIGQIEKKNRIVNLNGSIFDFLGKISYGIYVIHPLITFYLSKIIVVTDRNDVLNYIIVYFSVFAATIIVSYVSYHYFEKRFLDLKEKYSTIKSAG
jgi:peptidoglycan/LPS O-acetylase OafA/YrhL